MDSEAIVKTAKATIIKYSMLKSGDSVLAGVSGGADSIALAHILLRLRPEFNLRIGIAHLDHSLRGSESDHDAEFVLSFAKTFELPCYYHKADVKTFSIRHKLSTEEAGRILRHKFLVKTARIHGFDKIALGHQKDDLAETVLINILRGSGPQGISGIPPKRGLLIRPLINIGRSDLENFLTSELIAHVKDSTNTDLRIHRNRVRHHLIPFLKSEYNCEIVETLNRTAEILRDEQSWLNCLIEPLFKRIKLSEENANISLSVQELKKLPIAAARRLIRRAVLEVKGNLYGIGFKHLDAVLELITQDNPKNQFDLPGSLRIKRNHHKLIISRHTDRGRRNTHIARNKTQQPLYEYIIKGPQTVFIKEADQAVQLTELTSSQILRLKESNFHGTDPQEAYMDMASLSFPIIFRTFRTGDRFRPLGVSGFQKLKKFFINNKVPVFKRKQIPLLECSGKIIWVAGYRIDESVKVNPGTEKVLKARLLKGSTR